jgi:hypothetical protein
LLHASRADTPQKRAEVLDSVAFGLKIGHINQRGAWQFGIWNFKFQIFDVRRGYAKEGSAESWI